jgi:hypothetical protein
MPAGRRLRKIALWTCVAIPVLALMYMGAYYRMVTPVNGLFIGSNDRFYMRVNTHYMLPWPLPTHWNHAPLQQKLHLFFAPAHCLDRALRAEVWFEDRFAGVGTRNPDGSFTLRDSE